MSGVRGWILSLGMGQVRTTPYAEDVVVHAKLLPFGPGGSVAIILDQRQCPSNHSCVTNLVPIVAAFFPAMF